MKLLLRRITSVGFACSVAAAAAAPVSAQLTTFLEPVKDSSIFEASPSVGGNGCGTTLFTGIANPGAMRSLVRFDVAQTIPAGSQIVNVELTMSLVRSAQTSVPDRLSAHRLVRDWGEPSPPLPCSQAANALGGAAQPGDATWEFRFLPPAGSPLIPRVWNSPATAPGGDYEPFSSGGNLNVPTCPGGVCAPGIPVVLGGPLMPGDVQLWLDRPELNYGWILIGTETLPQLSGRQFDSREGGQVPILAIEYVPPGPGGVPDGLTGDPLLVNKLDPAGVGLEVIYDDRTCGPWRDHHLIYGGSGGFPPTLGGTYNLAGAACGAGSTSPYLWNPSADPQVVDPTHRLVWFLMVADDPLNNPLEGSWGKDSNRDERNGPFNGSSAPLCGIAAKDLSNECGAVCPTLDYWAEDPTRQSFFDLGNVDLPPIPPDFFYPGSDPFTGSVRIGGVLDDERNIDTIVRRSGPIDLTTAAIGSMVFVDVELVELSLTSLEPITVTGSQPPQAWEVAISLADNQDSGLLQAQKLSNQGGEAQTDLFVKPILAFARAGDLLDLDAGLIPQDQVQVRFFDYDDTAQPPIPFNWAGPMPWSFRPPDGFSCPDETWFPGVDPPSIAPGPPLVTPASGSEWNQVPPLVADGLCTYELIGASDCAYASAGPDTCAAEPEIQTTEACIPASGCAPQCPRFRVSTLSCGDCEGGECVAFYRCVGCR